MKTLKNKSTKASALKVSLALTLVLSLALILAPTFKAAAPASETDQPGFYPPLPTGVTDCVSCATSGFNGTAIGTDNFIWFSANMKASNIPASGAEIDFTDSFIVIQTRNGGDTAYPTPDGTIIFSPSETCAKTIFDGSGWVTTLPVSGSDEILLSAFGLQPTEELKGAKITWCATFLSDDPNIKINWKYGAAVYSRDLTEPHYNEVGVKPTHTNACGYPNSDHAGTPENWKSYLRPGAQGGGGSNWTGSWSGTKSVTTCKK